MQAVPGEQGATTTAYSGTHDFGAATVKNLNTPAITGSGAIIQGSVANAYYPEFYGAKGDGVTDDTVAIQAAMTAAGVAGGGTVVFAGKVYIIAGTLNLPALVSMLGAAPSGVSTVLKKNTAGTLLNVLNNFHRFDGIGFDGTAAPGVVTLVGIGTNTISSQFTTWRDCAFTTSNFAGSRDIQFSNNGASDTFGHIFINCLYQSGGTLVGRLIDFSGLSVITAPNQGTETAQFYGCQFIGGGNGNAQLDIQAPITIRGFGCTFVADGATTANIRFNTCNNCLFYGCKFVGSASTSPCVWFVTGNGNVIIGGSIAGGFKGIRIDGGFGNGAIRTSIAASNIVLDDHQAVGTYNSVEQAGNINLRGFGIAQPGIPATNVVLQNSTMQPVVVYLIGGTVTAIKVNGVTVATVSPATIFLDAGDSITLTYTAAPTWQWYGF